MSETKKCPECASNVPEEARKCAECGHKFVHRSSIAAPIVMVIALMLLAIAIFGDYAEEVLVGGFYLIIMIVVARSVRRRRAANSDAPKSPD